jgi:CheY-like chemotaxis protein
MNRLRILLAEDNAGDVLLVREALAKYEIPHELHVVRDGGEALAFVARIGEDSEDNTTPCPELLLLDLNLPKADGPTVLAAFRRHPLCAHTPVIAISSSDAVTDRERLARLGVSRYFRKPMELDKFLELGAVIRELMGEAGAGL